jgi:hypothetical protein
MKNKISLPIDVDNGYTPSTSKAMMVATMVPEKKSIFAVAYFATSENFNEYLPAAEQMVKSSKYMKKVL